MPEQVPSHGSSVLWIAGDGAHDEIPGAPSAISDNTQLERSAAGLCAARDSITHELWRTLRLVHMDRTLSASVLISTVAGAYQEISATDVRELVFEVVVLAQRRGRDRWLQIGHAVSAGSP